MGKCTTLKYVESLLELSASDSIILTPTLQEKYAKPLRAVVSKIGENFSRSFESIGCAGEVRLDENDDFEKWGIEVWVRYRDSEELRRLTRVRQSGGVRVPLRFLYYVSLTDLSLQERAVATITYLLAMQSLSAAPFRVVDEINQGSFSNPASFLTRNLIIKIRYGPSQRASHSQSHGPYCLSKKHFSVRYYFPFA